MLDSYEVAQAHAAVRQAEASVEQARAGVQTAHAETAQAQARSCSRRKATSRRPAPSRPARKPPCSVSAIWRKPGRFHRLRCKPRNRNLPKRSPPFCRRKLNCSRIRSCCSAPNACSKKNWFPAPNWNRRNLKTGRMRRGYSRRKRGSRRPNKPPSA